MQLKKLKVVVKNNFGKKYVWPWYVLLVTGIALSGLFPWLMVCRSCWKSKKKQTVLFVLVLNMVVYIFISWFFLTSKIVWWQLACFNYVFNFIWALSAWVFQNRFIGTADKRYILNQWRKWIWPLASGLIVAIGIAILISIPIEYSNRAQMLKVYYVQGQKTILWDFLKYAFLGIPIGLILGLWWAGEGRNFKIGRVITFGYALMLTIIWYIGLIGLFYLLSHKGISQGKVFSSKVAWALIPPWIDGFPKYAAMIEKYVGLSLLLVVPLLLGAPARIRDFWKKSLLIPLSFFCAMPFMFTGNDCRETIQDQVVYQTSSPNKHEKSAAYRQLDLILARYPQHQKWPYLADKLAGFYYKQGQHEKAEKLYQEIIDKYEGTYQYYWSVKSARTMLKSKKAGASPAEVTIEIPIIDYEQYLTHNWMAVLSLMRYWEGAALAESEIKIKLKTLSISEDKIDLNPLTNLAKVDDVVRSFGYEFLIVRAEYNKIKKLVSAQIPVLHQSYYDLNIIFGFDQTRDTLYGYNFACLSDRIKKEARKEAKEILSIKKEGHGKTKDRLIRIAGEAYLEWPRDYWTEPFLSYRGSLMAVLFPAAKRDLIAAALDTSWDDVKKESDGYLAALIGKSYLDHADPVNAIKWAKKSAKKTDNALPLHIACLANMFWEERYKGIHSKIKIQDSFPALAEVIDYFTQTDNRAFIEQAKQRFQKDLQTSKISWAMVNDYIDMLDNDPIDAKIIIHTMKKSLAVNPSYAYYWRLLANTYERTGNISEVVKALKNAVSCDPLDYKTKLRLAYNHILLEQYTQAQAVLDKTELSEIKFDADLQFCLGAIAQWQDKTAKAIRYYKKATQMCQYNPVYFQKYGKLLMQQGKEEKAKEILEWASTIKVPDAIKKKTELLWTEIKKKENP